jgi:drug/metabolite transporter (DMT)-like permease
MEFNRRTAFVYFVLLTAMLTWGLSFLAIKDVVKTVPVFTLLFLRFSVAAVILGIIGGIRGELRLPRRDFIVLAGLSLLSPIGYFLFETFGLAHTQPSHASVIIAAIPTVVFLIAFYRHQERATWKKVLGIAIAYAGIFLLVFSGCGEAGASLTGDLLILGAVLCAATRTVLLKDVLKRITPLQLTFYQFFFSLFLFGPLAATDGLHWLTQATPKITLEILFLGILCSAGAFLALHYALTHLSATQVASSTNFIPIITLFAEITLMGTLFTLTKGLGTIATIIGVTLTQMGERPTKADVIGIEEG